jgi:hypothetical protein
MKKGQAGCAPKGNPITSNPAIVASNPGDLVRGAFGASNTNASRYGDVAAVGTAAYVAVSSYAARLNSNAQRHHRLTFHAKA